MSGRLFCGGTRWENNRCKGGKISNAWRDGNVPYNQGYRWEGSQGKCRRKRGGKGNAPVALDEGNKHENRHT